MKFIEHMSPIDFARSTEILHSRRRWYTHEYHLVAHIDFRLYNYRKENGIKPKYSIANLVQN